MKKVLAALLGIGLLVGCSNETETPPKEESKEETTEPSQEELDAQLKEEATAANFVELNSDEAEDGKKVFAEGEVTLVTKEGALGEFVLTTEESDGMGMYTVMNLSSKEVAQGDKVTVYGTYSGKAEDGTPKLTVSIVE